MRLRSGVLVLLPFFLLRALLLQIKISRSWSPDVIHAHWVLPGGLIGALIARLLRIPLMVSLHGSDVFMATRKPLFGWVATWVLKQASVITACSEDLRQGALKLGADPDRVHLVAWGADPSRFSPDVPALNRDAFSLGADDLVLISLGRMVAKKGFDVLVCALPALVDAYPQLYLLIGGDGDQKGSLEKLAEDLDVLDRVRFPGRISWNDVPAFMAMGDLFVLPSVRDAEGNIDGLPTVLLEAMACGKPVVATKIGGVPLVIEDGVNGLLCRPGDVEALKRTISRVVEDVSLRERLGRRARASVESDYNWLEVARRISELLVLHKQV
jgi:glycosyltransferase involved in cell wall biosynthesis